MAIKNAIASLAVKDLGKSVEWYEKLFGHAPDARPMPELAEWQFERGGWLQLYRNKERAGSGSVTLSVDNLEEQIVALRALGIDPGREMSSEASKVVMIQDLDGNSIAFAAVLLPGMAQ